MCRRAGHSLIVQYAEGHTVNWVFQVWLRFAIIRFSCRIPFPFKAKIAATEHMSATVNRAWDALTAPTDWHEQGSASHVVQFYSEDGFLLDSLCRFIGTALGAGDGAIVIASQAHLLGLGKRLNGLGIVTATAIRQGRYVQLDAAETLARFMDGLLPDTMKFAEVVGQIISEVKQATSDESRLAIFGEMVALLWAQSNAQGAIRLEHLWNDLAKSHSFALRCGYPLQDFHRKEDADCFQEICSAHTSVIPGESYTALITDSDRLRNISQLQQQALALESEFAERKRAQSALQEREAELTDFLENALEGVQQIGPDQKIRWANRAMLDLLGYTSDEYVKQSVADFHLYRHDFDGFWKRLMQGESIYDFAASLVCNDGTIKHVLIHANGLWNSGELLYARCFVRDVTEQKRMEEALRQSKSELEGLIEQRTVALRRLSSQVLRLQDSERRRVARELHDSLGQYLAGLKLNIGLLRHSPARADLWAQSEQLMERCIAEVRTLAHLLHPPMMDEAGLASAAQWFVEGFARRTGLKTFLNLHLGETRLPDGIELAFFRVLQEAMTNVHRHSAASVVRISINQEPDRATLEIWDNGKGISPEFLTSFHENSAGLGIGLIGMRERIRELDGDLNLESSSSGTRVYISVPLHHANTMPLPLTSDKATLS